MISDILIRFFENGLMHIKKGERAGAEESISRVISDLERSGYATTFNELTQRFEIKEKAASECNR